MIDARSRIQLCLAVFALAAFACGGEAPPIHSAADIAAAEQNGTLSTLFDQLEADAASRKPGTPAATLSASLVADAGTRLSQPIETKVRAAIEAERLASGRLPLSTVDELGAEIGPLRRWNPAGYDALKADLDAERDQTVAAVEEQRAALEEIPASDFGPRLAAVTAVIALSGPDAPDAQPYVALRDEIVAGVESQLDEAIDSENFDAAQKMLAVVAEARGEDAALTERIVQVDAKLFEQRFWSALEKGQPNKAYSQLVVLAKSDRFARIRPSLAPSAQTMAEYFIEEGATAMSEERLHDAYTSFLQARRVRELVTGQPARPAPQEQLLIESVQKLYWDAHNSEKHGLAMGYLEVLAALQSETPTLRRLSRKTGELVTGAAAKRLSAYPFDETAGDSSFGVSISTKIIQNLIAKIPDDLRIIERDQLENIQREIQMQGGEGSELIAANYLVQGSILESRVDTTEKSGTKKMRVVTGRGPQPHPEYERWLALSDKERGKVAAPPASVEVETTEDVSVDITLHRKVGVFSVSYRMIDAESGEVLTADSAREKVEHTDESQGGVELGEFSLPFKLASLPSDLEILSELVDSIAETIASKLAETLSNPELKYLEDARQHAGEGNFPAASRDYAYAVALGGKKGKNVTAWRTELRRMAIATATGVVPARID